MTRPTPVTLTSAPQTPTVPAPPVVAESGRHAPAPPKTRRRPLLIVLAVVLVMVGSLLAAFVVSQNRSTVSVVAVKQTVTRGDVISAAVLETVEVPINSGLRTIPAADAQQLVGKRAAFDLHAGGLVSPESVAEVPFPESGRSVVGMSLKAGQLPTIRDLVAGAKVLIVYTPRAQDELAAGARTTQTVPAEVVGIRAVRDTTDVILDVSVATNQATGLAEMVATQRIAVILQGA